jgi:hypothetical protein
MADNDLEYGITTDLWELVSSQGVSQQNFETHIYLDLLNGDASDGTPQVDRLDFVYNSDGSETTSKFSGSRYLQFDHQLEKMVVVKQLVGEQNSDTFGVLQRFLEHAITDCVAKNAEEYMLIFSSHGAGFAGFGGDENTRKLEGVQSNPSITSAIGAALKVAGSPDKFNVLGFDACLMSSFAAFKEYAPYTDYFLASEAVEPVSVKQRMFVTVRATALTVVSKFRATDGISPRL